MVDDDYARRLSLAMGGDGTRPDTESIKALAKAIGITYQAVAKLWSDTSKMLSAKNNSLAAAFLHVDSDWLAVGHGEMRSNKVWPFGPAIRPEEFFSLGQDNIQAAIDVIEAAIKRQTAKAEPSRARSLLGPEAGAVYDRLQRDLPAAQARLEPQQGHEKIAGQSRARPLPRRGQKKSS